MSIQVVVPFTTLHPVTRAMLQQYAKANAAISLSFVRIDGSDVFAYGRLLAHMWRLRETFIVIEHDVLPWPGCIEELHTCPADWCANSYCWTNEHGRAGAGLTHMLGCTKIAAELMSALPNLWDEDCHWSQCDQRLFFAARDIGLEPHQHRPSVVHLKGVAA